MKKRFIFLKMNLAYWLDLKITIFLGDQIKRGYLVTDKNQMGEFYLQSKKYEKYNLTGKTGDVKEAIIFPIFRKIKYT